jgi:hypothetical protein
MVSEVARMWDIQEVYTQFPGKYDKIVLGPWLMGYKLKSTAVSEEHVAFIFRVKE